MTGGQMEEWSERLVDTFQMGGIERDEYNIR